MAPKKLPDQAYLRECFTYDAHLGCLRWKIRPLSHFQSEQVGNGWNTKYAGGVAGLRWRRQSRGIGIDGSRYFAHRLIWKFHHGTEPPEIDHWDNNPSNDRIENLRAATREGNTRNSSLNRNNQAGFKGVRMIASGRFQATIGVDLKRISLGTYDTAEEAFVAYCEAARRWHGAFWNPGDRSCAQRLRPLWPDLRHTGRVITFT